MHYQTPSAGPGAVLQEERAGEKSPACISPHLCAGHPTTLPGKIVPNQGAVVTLLCFQLYHNTHGSDWSHIPQLCSGIIRIHNVLIQYLQASSMRREGSQRAESACNR